VPRRYQCVKVGWIIFTLKKKIVFFKNDEKKKPKTKKSFLSFTFS